MKRVNVIGTAGAGKSTLGATLAARLGWPLIELDELHWQPGWQAVPLEEFRTKTAAAVAEDHWVVCGNYSGKVRDIVWGRADTLIWLDYALPVVLYRLYRRTWRRVARQEELWGGNRESWRSQFFSRESLLLYAVRTHRRRRQQIAALLSQGEYPELHVLRFRRPGETQGWLEGLCSFATAGASRVQV
jgi:adenylate kinase family enzyme